MQSVSASFGSRMVRRTREGLPGGVVWTAGLLFLLTLAIAKSTVAAQWVPGIEVVTMVALVGAVFMGLLAVLPIPWGAGVGIGMVAGPFVAGFASWPALHGSHPADPLGLGLLSAGWGRILGGSAIAESSFDLYLIGWLMWVTGGWLAWCVLRWRRPLLGLVPGAAAFATNILNFARDQNGYVLAILVLTLALLLWTNYTGSIADATRARVKLTGDARWDFWESGLVAMAALIVLAILLPPLSTADRTVDMESNAFNSWAQLLQTLSHPGEPGSGCGVPGNNDIIFYPGRLYRINRATQAIESIVPPPTAPGLLMNIDRLSNVSARSSIGTYSVTVEYSIATDADLQGAGTSYPGWVTPYTRIPLVYRSPALIERIHQLAL